MESLEKPLVQRVAARREALARDAELARRGAGSTSRREWPQDQMSASLIVPDRRHTRDLVVDDATENACGPRADVTAARDVHAQHRGALYYASTVHHIRHTVTQHSQNGNSSLTLHTPSLGLSVTVTSEDP